MRPERAGQRLDVQLTDAQADDHQGRDGAADRPAGLRVRAPRSRSYAKAHGVKVIDYDRLTLGGSRTYYVSFNNVQVGTAARQRPRLVRRGVEGAQSGLAHPKVIVMHGARPTTTRRCSRRAMTAVLKPLFKHRASGRTSPTPPERGRRRRRRPSSSRRSPRTEHERGARSRTMRTPRRSSPTCRPRGSSRTPSRSPARTRRWSACRTSSPATSAARSTSRSTSRLRRLRRSRSTCAPARRRPGLVNGTTEDTDVDNVSVPSVLDTPEWVTPANMEKTVVADDFVPAKQICAGHYAADCSKYGIYNQRSEAGYG